MKQYYVILAILVAIIMVCRILIFIRFRMKLKTKSIELIKLYNYKRYSNLYFVAGFCFLICIFFTLSHRGSYEVWYWNLIFLILLSIAQLVMGFIQPQNYFIIGSKGFKRGYGGMLKHWEKVEKMEISKYNPLNLKIVSSKRAYIFGFNERSDINNFLIRLKRFRLDITTSRLNF